MLNSGEMNSLVVGGVCVLVVVQYWIDGVVYGEELRLR